MELIVCFNFHGTYTIVSHKLFSNIPCYYDSFSYCGNMILILQAIKAVRKWTYRIPTSPGVKLMSSTYIASWERSDDNPPPPPSLKSVLADKIPERLDMVRKLRLKHGSSTFQNVTVDMLFAGLREASILISETTTASSDKGVRYRGFSAEEVRRLLPRAVRNGSMEPLPEAMLWLLLTGEVPSKEQVRGLSKELVIREDFPIEVVVAMRHLPPDMEPVPQLACALLMLSERSKFAVAIREDTPDEELWEYMLEDVLDMVATLPAAVAIVLQAARGRLQDIPPAELEYDWSANLALKMGFFDNRIEEFLRLYMTIHCDYETSNVATHSATLLGSALADPYVAVASATMTYHTPRFGRCQMDVLKFLQNMQRALIPHPSNEKVAKYLEDYILKNGCIPGFGHSVHRVTDSRYIVQQEFSDTHLDWHPLVRLASQTEELAPALLKSLARKRHPTPNTQLASAPAFYALGLTESEFYPVLAATSRAIGVGAALVWARALRQPLERPRAISTDSLWLNYGMY